MVSLFIEKQTGLMREGYKKFQLRNLLHSEAKLDLMIILNIFKSPYYLFTFDFSFLNSSNKCIDIKFEQTAAERQE